jgi:Ca2+-binding RTX toxin-like protein
MNVHNRARPRGRTRRALLAAALPAVLAAVALPSAANAASVSDGVGSSGERIVSVLDRSFFFGGSVENNDVTVRVQGDSLVIRDDAGITTEHQGNGGACFRLTTVEARCPRSVGDIQLNLAAGNDHVEYRAPQSGFVNLGVGSDRVVGGLREASGLLIDPVVYSGGTGIDSVNYAGADRGVRLTPEDGLANDGRLGDKENVGPDFETFFGSFFSDAPFFGTPRDDQMFGLGGDDQIAGGGGNDVFYAFEGDGADDYHGGPARDAIDYESHDTPLNVSLDNVANDGASGERDNVRSNVESIFGGSAGDTLNSFGAFSALSGRGGIDTLIGGSGPDTLVGGAGRDTLDAGSGNDVVAARDGELDDVECGSDTDSATIDNGERVLRNCETLDFTVGILKLAPTPLAATAGETARVRLSWRHPRAWRKLRKVELRLTRNELPVGGITIRPRAGRIAAGGAVELVRKRTRLTRDGKSVSARLAIRLDESLAGQTLTAEVEATDTRGRRQLERDAGTVRVAG